MENTKIEIAKLKQQNQNLSTYHFQGHVSNNEETQNMQNPKTVSKQNVNGPTIMDDEESMETYAITIDSQKLNIPQTEATTLQKQKRKEEQKLLRKNRYSHAVFDMLHTSL